MDVTFASSLFPPLALGFFGLGVGYLIWGRRNCSGIRPGTNESIAFSAYGIHWLALGWNRYRGDDPRPNAGMSVAFAVLSALGLTVFFHAGDWPVGLVFVGLTGVYVSEFLVTLGAKQLERLLGLIRVLTGLWLMYLTFAVTLNFAAGFHLTV
jgi:hypothetical protein